MDSPQIANLYRSNFNFTPFLMRLKITLFLVHCYLLSCLLPLPILVPLLLLQNLNIIQNIQRCWKRALINVMNGFSLTIQSWIRFSRRIHYLPSLPLLQVFLTVLDALLKVIDSIIEIIKLFIASSLMLQHQNTLTGNYSIVTFEG